MASSSTGPGSKDNIVDTKIASVKSGGMTWVDIVDPGPAERAILARDYHFHPLDLEAILSAMQLTKVEDHGEYFFISLNVPEQVDKGVIASIHVSVFMGMDYLVTLHPSRLSTISGLFRACRDEDAERGEFMRSPAYLVYRLIDRLVDDIFSILDTVQESLDSIEAVVFDEKKSSALAINAARRQIATLRRLIDALNLYAPDLAKAQKFSKDDLTIYFSDVRHKVGKLSATIEEMKDTVEIYNDTDFSTSSNKTNTVLSFLTIIFTLTLPAAVIAAFYGMNIPIPGALTPGAWTSPLGEYTSLSFILVLIFVPTIIMGMYFRRKGWF